jgi:PEP-CTERM motif
MMTLPILSRKLARLLPVSLLALPLGFLPARAATIVYTVNSTITSTFPTGISQTNSVIGTVTTNGTIGTLTSAEIVGYNLNLIDTLNAANDFTLTNADSTIARFTAGALTATATGLFFNYSGTGEILVQANTPGPLSPYHYFCLSTGIICYAGESITPNYLFGDGAVDTGTAEPVGTQSLNQPGTVTTTAVPEPSTYGLVLTGLLGLGGAVKRKFFC